MCAGAWPNLGSSATLWEGAAFLCGPKDSCISPQTHSPLAASCTPGLLRKKELSFGPRSLPPELQTH